MTIFNQGLLQKNILYGMNSNSNPFSYLYTMDFAIYKVWTVPGHFI